MAILSIFYLYTIAFL